MLTEVLVGFFLGAGDGGEPGLRVVEIQDWRETDLQIQIQILNEGEGVSEATSPLI
jgi:hypothetical protein